MVYIARSLFDDRSDLASGAIIYSQKEEDCEKEGERSNGEKIRIRLW